MRKAPVFVTVLSVVVAVGGIATPAGAQTPTPTGPSASTDALKSSPPDRTIHAGSPANAFAPAPSLSTAGVFTVDASAAASSGGGNEPAIAVNPANPNQIAITRFNASWPSNADLLYSTDGGITWTNEATIPAPPGVSGSSGCPCDQTIDYGRDGTLYGTFLLDDGTTSGVVSGSTTDPTSAASWTWNGSPAQLTSGTRPNVDQPWLLVNRDPATATQDNAYVAYDDFDGAPDERVAASLGASPVDFTRDNRAGSGATATNPGLRMAADPRNGAMYALFETSSGSSQPKNVTYRLNRSTDGGQTWTLNGDSNGIAVDSVSSDQAPGFKFGTVNALLGGVDHAAVDPSSGDVYVAYGQDVSGGNQIKIRRLTDNGSGGLTIGAASNVSTSTDAALPSVAVLSDGTVGVLYDTFDGTTTTGFPFFSAHLARSTDHGATFTDTVLRTFQSPVTDNNDGRQRILGDFHQMKAVGNTFYGAFSGNASGVPATGTPPIHAMFFSVPQRSETTLFSSANPSVFGQPVTFTAAVRPVPDGGTVSFTVDGTPLGGPVPVDTTTGRATSAPISTLGPGSHQVVATYSGDDNFGGSSASLVQVVGRAPVTTTITSSVNPALFGHPVTLTDTVCPGAASTGPAAPPTGLVTIADGSGVLGHLPVQPGGGPNCSSASVTTSNLLPGSHAITATYTGDANYLSGGLETLTQNVACTRTITGRVNGAIIASGDSTCIINATVNGAVLGHAGTAIFIGNSSVSGSVLLDQSTLVGVCGSRVDGSVQISRSSRFVVIGDPGDDNCAADTIGGAFALSQNHGGLEMVNGTVGGSMQVSGNSGTGPFPEDVTTELENNTVRGALNCSGNVPPPSNDGQPNHVSGPRAGQCATL